jgi:hypothetical protein
MDADGVNAPSVLNLGASLEASKPLEAPFINLSNHASFNHIALGRDRAVQQVERLVRARQTQKAGVVNSKVTRMVLSVGADLAVLWFDVKAATSPFAG